MRPVRVLGDRPGRFEQFERGQAMRALNAAAGQHPAGSGSLTGPAAAQLLDRMPAQQRQAIEQRHRPLRRNEGLSFRLAPDGRVLVRQRGRDLTVHPDGTVTRGWPARPASQPPARRAA